MRVIATRILHTKMQPITHVDRLAIRSVLVEHIDKALDRIINIWFIAFEGGKRIRMSHWPPESTVRLFVADRNQSCLRGT
jgi:hypothetical protein